MKTIFIDSESFGLPGMFDENTATDMIGSAVQWFS